MYIYQDQIYQNIPERIRLDNGSTRTSLNELTLEQQEALGVYYYQDITPLDYLSEIWTGGYISDGVSISVKKYIPTKIWNGSYTIDHENKTISKTVEDRDLTEIKYEFLLQLSETQLATQYAGYTCFNSIKLQTREEDLLRWTQLMTGLLSFEPAQVSIRDYDNINHIVNLADATQMLAEIFVWGQTFLSDTWTKKDAILNAVSIEDLAVE